MAKMPCVPCTHPYGRGDIEAPCRVCLGSGVVVSTGWGAAPKLRPRPTPTPVLIHDLRALCCRLSDYPLEGTPEWDALVEAHRAAVRARVEGLPKRKPVAPRRPPRRTVTTVTPVGRGGSPTEEDA